MFNENTPLQPPQQDFTSLHESVEGVRKSVERVREAVEQLIKEDVFGNLAKAILKYW